MTNEENESKIAIQNNEIARGIQGDASRPIEDREEVREKDDNCQFISFKEGQVGKSTEK